MKKLKLMLFTVAALCVSLLASCSSGYSVEDIREYIDMTAGYEAGSIDYDKGTYSSEYWDIQVDFDGNWVVYPEEDMNAAAKSLYDSVIPETIAEYKDDNASDEVIAVLEESASVNVEFMAGYYVDDGYLGMVQAYTMTVYSDDRDELLRGFVDGMKEMMPDCKIGDKTIDSNEYTCITGTVTQSGVAADTTVLAKEKDGVYLFVMVMGLDDGGATSEAFISLLE